MQPVAYFLISALATGIIVSLGVREGIERIVTVGTMGLPIAAFLVALIFKWFMKSDVHKGMTGTAEVWLCTLNVLTKYAIPAVLLIITISTLIGL